MFLTMKNIRVRDNGTAGGISRSLGDLEVASYLNDVAIRVQYTANVCNGIPVS